MNLLLHTFLLCATVQCGLAQWDFPGVPLSSLPNTPGYQLGGQTACRAANAKTPEYKASPTVPEGFWDGDVSMHDPTHLIQTEDGTLLVFVSGQGFCGQRAIGYKYMLPNTNKWIVGPQMFGGCTSAEQPSWIPGNGDLQDFDAPGVLYSSTPVFPTPNFASSSSSADLRQWVMYYSVYLNTADVPAADEDNLAQACIGRATATGTPANLVWVDDGKPVYCSNVNYDSNGHPLSLRFSTEAGYVAATLDGYAIDPAIIKDGTDYYMSWGSGILQLAKLDAQTGHLEAAAISSNCNGPCKDDSTSSAYTVLSYGAERFSEAPYILFRNGFHYLFVNWWGCCNDICSTYDIRVGRSSTGILGPYLDKNGNRMDVEMSQTVYGYPSAGGTLLLAGEGRYIGPGHAGVLVYTSTRTGAETLAFTFHYYDRDEDGVAKLAGRILTFDSNNWPVVGNDPWDVGDATGSQAPTAAPITPSPTPSPTAGSNCGFMEYVWNRAIAFLWP